MEIETGKCLCGCNETVSPGKQWVQGHHLRVQKPKEEIGAVVVAESVIELSSKPSGDAYVEQCAKVVLDFVGGLDPDWQKRITIMLTDNDWTARKAIGSMAAYVLDRSLHTSIPRHPYFEKGNHPYRDKACKQCGKTFHPSQAGQIFDSNECAFAFQRVAIDQIVEAQELRG